MPAMRATASASPFLRVASLRAVWVAGFEKRSVATAVAQRWVGVLEAMLIMCAVPVGVR